MLLGTRVGLFRGRTTCEHYSGDTNPIPNIAGDLNSAGMLVWYIPALYWDPPTHLVWMVAEFAVGKGVELTRVLVTRVGGCS